MAEDEVRQPLLQQAPKDGIAVPYAGLTGNEGSCILAGGAELEQTQGQAQRKLIIALLLALIFMVVEVAGGFVAHSLAVMTDAAHLLSDVGGFAVAIFAGYYAMRKSHSSHTFGYHRVEVLGALVSVLSTWLVTGILIYEAINRILHPTPVDGKLMFLLAILGVVINLVIFGILGGHGHSHSHAGHDHGHGHSHGPKLPFTAAPKPAHNHGGAHTDEHEEHDCYEGYECHEHEEAEGNGEMVSDAAERGESCAAGCGTAPGPHAHGHAHDHGHGHSAESINMRSAALHVVGDLVQSLGVALAGALLWWKQGDPRWYIVDPLCTFLFAGLVLLTTRAILRDIADVLMERVPRAHDAATIAAGLMQIQGVTAVHDLHIWDLKPGVPLLAAHLDTQPCAASAAMLRAATAYCQSIGIVHSTLQINDAACGSGQCIAAAPALLMPPAVHHH